MIAVKIEGRLGNQLFQYAFIYSTAQKLKTSFYLDKSVDYLIIDKYFDIEPDFCNSLDKFLFSVKGYKNLFSHYSRWSFYYLLKRILSLKDESILPTLSTLTQIEKIRDNRIYKGYFQSEDFFVGYKEDVINNLAIKDFYKNEFTKALKNIPANRNKVVIHVRRGDFVTLSQAMDINYYHKAIKSIHTEDNFYIFISDDIEFVKQQFGYIGDKYLSDNNEIIDFQFLMHGDICILSGSSYSWWGAYLNKNSHKQVFVPEYWLGHNEKKEYPVGILNNLRVTQISY